MRIAVVVPRYGSHIVGGAETLARGFAEKAVEYGWDVEVWTTCVQNHYTWENVFTPGHSIENRVHVWRFPAIIRNPEARSHTEMQLASRGSLSIDDQYRWLESGVHSPALYAHILTHSSDVDVLVMLPYTVQLIHYAVWLVPEKTVLWPCLHDEPYAYLEPVRLLMEKVMGIAFNTPEEGHLASHLLKMKLPQQMVLGAGVQSVASSTGAEVSSQTLLYIGRLEEGKNLSLLYKYIRKYAENGGNLKLAIIGKGPLLPPAHSAFEYRGFLSEEEKSLACASALAVCQPSLNESFSITIMEAWLAGRPVLVHQDCPVTVGHVRRSNGGLWFGSYDEFKEAVTWLQMKPELATRMGRNGKNYVEQNYTWDAVIHRFQQAISQWTNLKPTFRTTEANDETYS